MDLQVLANDPNALSPTWQAIVLLVPPIAALGTAGLNIWVLYLTNKVNPTDGAMAQSSIKQAHKSMKRQSKSLDKLTDTLGESLGSLQSTLGKVEGMLVGSGGKK